MKTQRIFIGVVIAAVLGLVFPDIHSPPEWLVAWTGWVLSAAGIAAALAGTTAAMKYLSRL